MTYAPTPRFGPDDHRMVREPLALLRSRSEFRTQTESERSFRMLVLVTLNALDLFSTAVVLSLGGVEANPILAPVIHTWWMPTLMKAIVLGVIWGFVRRCPVESVIADRILQFGCFFYAAVVFWNVQLFLSVAS